MLSKSTLKLVPGDFCLIPRQDGNVVAFAYLCSVPGKRSYFYGALLSPAFAGTMSSELPSNLEIASRAMVHIKCFSENNTPIIGNAAKQIGSTQLSAAQNACTNLSEGSVHSVWGHRTIIRRAEEIEA